MDKDDGGPAFPRAPFDFVDQGLAWSEREQRGMSLRDWFAGRALAGMGGWCPEVAPLSWSEETVWKLKAEWAYGQADAMLRARKEV